MREVSRADVRTEVAAGRWTRCGRHTVLMGTGAPTGPALWWRAVWESGSGSRLDGVAALEASGLTGFEALAIDVSIPSNNRRHRVQGVRLHRRSLMPPAGAAGVPRVDVPYAAVHAAVWAATDRQAALVLCLVLQQRLTTPSRLLVAWAATTVRVRRERRALVDDVLHDLCDGAHSLGELDFAGMCRGHGLPEPSRQVVRTLPGGRVYLDVCWEDIGLAVEIDGGQHALALNTVDDALRQNEVVLGGSRVLRIPVVGLRLSPDRFMAQVVDAHRRWSRGVA